MSDDTANITKSCKMGQDVFHVGKKSRESNRITGFSAARAPKNETLR